MPEVMLSVVDNVVLCKTALARAERLTTEIEAISPKITMCREAWKDYGQGLLEQRKLIKSKPQFGQWVKANGLDTGLASSHVTRSNAIWLAANWAYVAKTTLKNHNPTNIRQECRDAGHVWAFDPVSPPKKLKPRVVEPLDEDPEGSEPVSEPSDEESGGEPEGPEPEAAKPKKKPALPPRKWDGEEVPSDPDARRAFFDRVAANIILQLAAMEYGDLTDPSSFAGKLFGQVKRFSLRLDFRL